MGLLDWKNAKNYYWGRNVEIWVLKARPTDPVRFYGEIRENDSYYASFGSKLPFSWMAMLSGLVRKRWL